MSGSFRQKTRFYYLYILKSLTSMWHKALNILQKKNKEGDIVSLPLRDPFYESAQSLPGNAQVTGFRPERYRGVGDQGPERIVHELLVNLSVGNNEVFFSSMTHKKERAEADRHIVSKALDYASEKNLFPVAINIYLHTAYDQSFIDDVLGYLNERNIPTSSVIFELLEHDMPAPGDDLSALTYALEKGLTFALDDFDPRGEGQLERLEILAPYCNYVKFDKKVLWAYEAGEFDPLPDVVEAIRSEYPAMQFIAEGVTQDFVQKNRLAFHKTQKSGWGDLEP